MPDADALPAQALATSLAEAVNEGDAGKIAAASALPVDGEAADADGLSSQTTALQAAAAAARLPQDARAAGTDASPAPAEATALLAALGALPTVKPAPTGASMLAAAVERQAKTLPESSRAEVQGTAASAAAPMAGAAAAAAFDRIDPASAASTSTPLVDLASLHRMPAATERAGAPSTALPVLTVAPPVGSPEWGPAMGQQVIRMHAGGQQTAELNLNPAGLGPLKVTLSIGDNQAQAMFVSAHESVRKAVEAALPQLRNALAEQGISLGQTSVGAESRQWAGQAGGFDQQQQHQRQGGSGNTPYPSAARVDAAAPAIAAAARSASGAGVDTFA
ncbi:MAG: flagellar hook-length control protein FliK [Variovorax sp.]